MKGVLGFLFIFSGLTVGYLVLAGKLPNPNASSQPKVIPGQQGDKSTGKETLQKPSSNALGIPATTSTRDLTAGRLRII